jgi:hypothetical protein
LLKTLADERFRVCLVGSFLTLFAGATACSSSSPAQPSGTSPSTGASALTASVTVPRPSHPANGTVVPNAAQPVTLTVLNAVVTKSSGTTYTFEVATDAAFTNKVQTKDGVAEGSSGQTSVTLDALPAAADYYWRARATGGGTTGPFGTTFKFTIAPPVTINAPLPIAPLSGAQTGPRPSLRVRNATRTGPAGPLTYKFEVATTATFSPTIVTGFNVEGISETGFIPTADLPTQTRLYWRATAIDAANGVTSPPSAVQTFTANSQASLVAAKLGVPLWPGAQPPGNTGHAVMGTFWNVEPITSYTGVTFINPPLDELQIFDLLDRGMDPQSAINWMNTNGYPTQAAFYPSVSAIGFAYEYMAFVNGAWDLVLRVGA